MPSVHPQQTDEKTVWIIRIQEAIKNKQLLGSTCTIYTRKDAEILSDNSKQCLCGRLARCHSFDGDAFPEPIGENESWDPTCHRTASAVTVYGIWNNKTKVFISTVFFFFIYLNLVYSVGFYSTGR